MKIYWNLKDIPALKNLSPKERRAAVAAVSGKVWKHWQVWLPLAGQIVAYLLFANLVPQFPHRFFVVMAVIIITVKLAGLPRNYYIQHYLSLQPIQTK